MTEVIFEKLEGLRTELIDLAFSLERRGRLDAADVALMTFARIGELCEEPATPANQHPSSGRVSIDSAIN